MEYLDPIIDVIAVNVIKVLAAVLTTLLTGLLFQLQAKVKAWMLTKLTNEQVALLEAEAMKLVRYLWQADYLDLRNPEKKEYAMGKLTEFCEAHNLPFDRDDIDQMVEAAVAAIKEAYGKAVP
jgi:hypothetical protein